TALSDRHQAAMKRESDIDRESGSVSGSRQLIERVQSLLVVRGCRSSGTPRSCFVRGVAKSDRCLFPHLAVERMMSDPLDLFHETVCIQTLDGLRHTGVEIPSSLMQERSVGDLLGQRVLERVFAVRMQGHLVEEFGRL